MIENFSLVPQGYKEKDPRGLAFLYPQSLNIVAYAKKMQIFSFYQALDVAENMAKSLGFILLPYSCIHWERRKKFGKDRKVKVGRKSFFMLRENELTKNEKSKLYSHLADIKKEMIEGGL